MEVSYKTAWMRRKRGWTKPTKRACAVCKVVFMPPVFHPKSETCSRVCSKKLTYRRNREHYIVKAQKWAAENRERCNSNYRAYRKLYPQENAARSKVGYALKTGKLLRPDHCSKCKIKCKPEAHHHRGYDKPLEVKWLCKSCHAATHQVSA
jgi:hypothetical protein